MNPNFMKKMDSAGKSVLDVMQIRGLVISIIIALVLILFGGFIVGMTAGHEYLPVEAEVLNVTFDDALESYEIEFKYTVDGKEYTSSLDGSDYYNYNPGDKLSVFYDAENPETVSSSESNLVFTIAGGIVVLVGVFFFISGIMGTIIWFRKRNLERAARADVLNPEKVDENDFKEYDFMTEVQEKMNEMITNRVKFGATTEFMKEGYFFKDANGEKVFTSKANLHLGLIPATHEFSSTTFRGTETHKIRLAVFGPSIASFNLGKLGQVSAPVNSVAVSEYIVDGQRYWEGFYREGFYIDRDFDGIRSIYSVKRGGVEIAEIRDRSLQETGNVNIGILKEMPSVGQFKVRCRECDMDKIFMLCILISNSYK